MNRKWMPITVGIIELIFGVFGILYGTAVLIFGPLLYGSKNADYEIWGPLYLLIGVLIVIGSIFTIKRKRWRLALGGAISAFLFSAIYTVTDLVYNFSLIKRRNAYGGHFSYLSWDDLGYLFAIIAAIFAIVLTVKARRQFNR